MRGGTDVQLLGYVDSDFAADIDSRKSTTGYVFTFRSGAVSWMSRLQNKLALSTTEAEYVAATEACKKMIWLKDFLKELEKEQFVTARARLTLQTIRSITLEPSTLMCGTTSSARC